MVRRSHDKRGSSMDALNSARVYITSMGAEESSASEKSRIITEAAILWAGFQQNCYTRKDIEHWADTKIEALDEPQLEILELAMTRGKSDDDLLSLLASVGARAVPDIAARSAIVFAGRQY